MIRSMLVLWIGLCFATIQAYAYSGGTGEPNNPYQIATAEDLIALGNEPNDYNDCFILTADIDLSGYSFDRAVIAPDTNDSRNYFQGTQFSGFFSGQGHIVYGLQIEGKDYLGLFGICSAEAMITNLGLETVEVNGTGDYVGGLVGANYGSITLSYSSGIINGSQYTGGLAGYNKGAITLSYSDATVTGSQCIGGLIGYCGYDSQYATSTITFCYGSGTVNGNGYVGGLIGRSNGSVAFSFSTAIVQGQSDVGGLVGYQRGTIASSFWDIEVSGQSQSAGGVGLPTAEMQAIETYQNAGWDLVSQITGNTCNAWVMQEGTYPSLAMLSGYSPTEPNGLGTQEDPYLLTDVNELKTVMYRPWAHYRLEADIDLAGTTWHSAVIPVFTGSFDGNEYVIHDLCIEGHSNLGLVGYCMPQATLTRLILEAVDINGIGDAVGGLAGNNAGSISLCSCSGTVQGKDYVGGLVGTNYENSSITLSYNSAMVTGDTCVGGLAGQNQGLIRSSVSSGTIHGKVMVGGLAGKNTRGIGFSHCSGAVHGNFRTGGLVGYNNFGTIFSNSNSGDVNGAYVVGGLTGHNDGAGEIMSSFNTGVVRGDVDVGGLAGRNKGSIISNYNNGSVFGEISVGGLVGYNDGSFDWNYDQTAWIESNYSTGAVSGNVYVGGFVGVNDGEEGWIGYCYSTGRVSGDAYVGGFVGYNNPDGDIYSCFWDTEASGQNTNTGGMRRSTTEMQDINTFLNARWDFVNETTNGTDDIWIMQEADYPHLTWEFDID